MLSNILLLLSKRISVLFIVPEYEFIRWLKGKLSSVALILLNFQRLKALGFVTREDLARFFEILPALVDVTEYDLDTIAALLNAVEPPLAGPERIDVATLKYIARAWMDDMHEYCNVSNSSTVLDRAQTRFMHACREFRRANMWLRQNFGPQDHFDYLRPIDGRTVFAALRHGPGMQVLTVAHMEGGETLEIDPLRLDIPGAEGFGWELALRTPSIARLYPVSPIAFCCVARKLTVSGRLDGFSAVRS